MKNILSIDVEEHFQVEALRGAISRATWDTRQSRLTMNLVRLLDILDQHQVTATFFVVGWVADRSPHLIAMVKARGHEIASHGYNHLSLKKMTPNQFREDLQKSLDVIYRAGHVVVKGYRAPTFSAERDKTWIWETLLEFGIKYDSSIYPVKHDLYGDPQAPRFPYFLSTKRGKILEIPPTTYKFWGRVLPACGGGSFRLFPYWYTKRAINAYNSSGYAAVVYVHPWEIDPAQPREKVDLKNRIRHYTNLHRVEGKLRRLLSEYKFGSITEVYLDISRQQADPQNRGIFNG